MTDLELETQQARDIEDALKLSEQRHQEHLAAQQKHQQRLDRLTALFQEQVQLKAAVTDAETALADAYIEQKKLDFKPWRLAKEQAELVQASIQRLSRTIPLSQIGVLQAEQAALEAEATVIRTQARLEQENGLEAIVATLGENAGNAAKVKITGASWQLKADHAHALQLEAGKISDRIRNLKLTLKEENQ